jgi:hypothetical protein
LEAISTWRNAEATASTDSGSLGTAKTNMTDEYKKVTAQVATYKSKAADVNVYAQDDVCKVANTGCVAGDKVKEDYAQRVLDWATLKTNEGTYDAKVTLYATAYDKSIKSDQASAVAKLAVDNLKKVADDAKTAADTDANKDKTSATYLASADKSVANG